MKTNDACAAIQLISSAKDMAPEYKYLMIRLRLEQQRLNSWSSEVGLQRFMGGDIDTDNSDMLGLNRRVIL